MLAVTASSALRRQAAIGAPRVILSTLSATSPSQPQTRAFAADTVYKFNVTPEHMATVQATLPLVGKAGTAFTKHFYGRLFAAHPELLNVFNQTNQALGKQPQKLLKTVAVAAQSALDTGTLPGEAIEGISQKHVALGIGKEAYDVVGAHLLGTIEDLLTDDKAVLDAWADLYGDIANVFITRERELAEEKASIPGSWMGRRSFRLAGKEKLSTVITRFKFEPVDGQPTPKFEPGQFTTIWAKVDEEGVHGRYTEQPRHYTLALPREGEDADHSMSISVKKEGLVSRMLHKAEVGSNFDLSAPQGCFTMSGVEKMWLSEGDAPIVFISAGVGITPVLAMLENIYTTRPATWLHASMNGDVHAYRDRLRGIASVRAGELQRRVWYEEPLETDGTAGGDETSPHLFNLAKYHYNGRMDLQHPSITDSDHVLHLDDSNASYFLCGPPAFMDAQKDALLNLGVSGDRIHWEGF